MIDFNGDVRATEVSQLREEVTAVLSVANETDEILLRLESPGGVVHGYGLAASQLSRIVGKGLKLTIAVDKVAASGGYMMACIGTRILAAPFAVLGSIGVVAELPNFHRLLKKYDVDMEVMNAGEYKRTLTMFGENTEQGREKFQEELEDEPPVYGVLKPVRTWNPLIINFQHLWGLIFDAWHTRSIKEKLTLWWKPTGYRPEDVKKRFPRNKITSADKMEKYNPESGGLLKSWAMFQWLGTTFMLLLLLANYSSFGNLQALLFGGVILLSIFGYTSVMDSQMSVSYTHLTLPTNREV